MSTLVVGRFVGGRGWFGENVVARQALDGVATRQKTRLEIRLQHMGLIFAELLTDPGVDKEVERCRRTKDELTGQHWICVGNGVLLLMVVVRLDPAPGGAPRRIFV